MSGHVDIRVIVPASLDEVWRREDYLERRQEIIAKDRGRNSIVFHVVTPPDAKGRRWSYNVERVTDRPRQVAYARRWGNPAFLYSYAFWEYAVVAGGTEIRCVTDFEMRPGMATSDSDMQEIIRAGTESFLRELASGRWEK